MTEEKPLSWKLDPPHISMYGNVLDDQIKGHLKLRSKLEELRMREAVKRIQDENNRQVPVRWISGTYTIVAKFPDGYKSTDDYGNTWRDATPGEIEAFVRRSLYD